ncbi:MAG: hypothetical protein ACREHG_03535, partial [Candidatus Saccharimonadales bacterium]
MADAPKPEVKHFCPPCLKVDPFAKDVHPGHVAKWLHNPLTSFTNVMPHIYALWQAGAFFMGPKNKKNPACVEVLSPSQMVFIHEVDKFIERQAIVRHSVAHFFNLRALLESWRHQNASQRSTAVTLVRLCQELDHSMPDLKQLGLLAFFWKIRPKKHKLQGRWILMVIYLLGSGQYDAYLNDGHGPPENAIVTKAQDLKPYPQAAEGHDQLAPGPVANHLCLSGLTVPDHADFRNFCCALYPLHRNDDDPPASLLNRLTISMSAISHALLPLVGPAPPHPSGGVSVPPASPLGSLPQEPPPSPIVEDQHMASAAEGHGPYKAFDISNVG